MLTIAEVIERLEQIVAACKAQQSPLGYFAAVYLTMTTAVRDAIQNGEFENGSRMEQMDVVFAKRYIEAYETWQAGQMPTQAWQRAFTATQDDRLCAMQHILLGMNAHINLDLGIAAATVRQRDAIFGMHRDFEHINTIIASLVDSTQECLAHIWLPFSWLDGLMRTEDEGYINFSIRVARGAAWKYAVVLAFAPDLATERRLVDSIDGKVAAFARCLLKPGILLGLMVRLMRRFEQGTVAQKIEALERIGARSGA